MAGGMGTRLGSDAPKGMYNIGITKDVYIFERLICNLMRGSGGKLITAKYKVSKYIFFSLSGYTDWFQTLSDEDVILLTLDSLYTDTEKEKY